jgi:hypothetical protein
LACTLQKERRISFRDALILASRHDVRAAEAYLLHHSSATVSGEPIVERPSSPQHVTDHSEESSAAASGPLLSLAQAIAKDRRISLRAALAEASRRDPMATQVYTRHFGLR